ncbi:unnamed protein product [Sphagnum balticum]
MRNFQDMWSRQPTKRLGSEFKERQQLAELSFSPPPILSSQSSSCRTLRRTQGDRFIPNRSAMDLDVAHFNLLREAKENVDANLTEKYRKKLAENLFHDVEVLQTPKILAFHKKPPVPSPGAAAEHPLTESFASPPSRIRKIPQSPDRVLDAPELLDDYYLNLLDWSCKNVVAVALGTTVYLWHAETGAIEQLMSTRHEDDYISSISWAQDGRHIALGLNSREVQLWDTSRICQVRKMVGHSGRVSSLAWNQTILSSGGRDSHIINHDVRVRDHVTSHLIGHCQEVCGLKWSPSGHQLASGGNDNLLHIWDAAASASSAVHLHRLENHQAAVKALAWCPFQANLLASGGGTADRCIKFWNTQSGACINSIDTYSQVCALQWNRHQKELLSSHGFSRNQLILWKYPSMSKLAELTGHTARVLHLAQNPDGTTVVSAAADETLRFWKVFGAAPSPRKAMISEAGDLSLRSINIR